MSQNDFILSLFELTDPHLSEITINQPKRVKGRKIHVIKATLSYPLKRCPQCGFKALIKNGTHLSKVRLGTLAGGCYELHLKRQRYLCHHCGATCGAQTTLVKFN
ncbi:transposase family protein [Lacticaseibacillus thailandensis]